MKITFDSWEEFDELYYACREAEIRFKRLRTQVDPSVTECEEGLTDDRFRLIVEE